MQITRENLKSYSKTKGYNPEIPTPTGSATKNRESATNRLTGLHPRAADPKSKLKITKGSIARYAGRKNLPLNHMKSELSKDFHKKKTSMRNMHGTNVDNAVRRRYDKKLKGTQSTKKREAFSDDIMSKVRLLAGARNTNKS